MREGIKQPDIAEPTGRSKSDIGSFLAAAKAEAGSPEPQRDANTEEERLIQRGFAVTVAIVTT